MLTSATPASVLTTLTCLDSTKPISGGRGVVRRLDSEKNCGLSILCSNVRYTRRRVILVRPKKSLSGVALSSFRTCYEIRRNTSGAIFYEWKCQKKCAKELCTVSQDIQKVITLVVKTYTIVLIAVSL